MLQRFCTATLLTAGLLALAPCTHAAVITYNTLSSFVSAAGTVTNTNFEGIVPPGGSTFYPSGVTFGGVNIASSSGTLYVLSSTALTDGDLGTGDYMEGAYNCHGCGTSGSTTFTLPAGMRAFAIDFRAYNQQPGNHPANFLGSFAYDAVETGGVHSTGTAIADPLQSTFIGFLAGSQLVSITFTPNGDNPGAPATSEFFHFDNMRVGDGNTSATPEPGSLSMMGIALISIGLYRRR